MEIWIYFILLQIKWGGGPHSQKTLPSCFFSQHKFPCSLHTVALPVTSGIQTWDESSHGGGCIETGDTVAQVPLPQVRDIQDLKDSRRRGSVEAINKIPVKNEFSYKSNITLANQYREKNRWKSKRNRLFLIIDQLRAEVQRLGAWWFLLRSKNPRSRSRGIPS